ncbi:MAG: putative signal peptide peptidase SppA [Chlamydiae bacterium]|nr:putative signal peptide peptidase SppA [Chlamydiota bacterium]
MTDRPESILRSSIRALVISLCKGIGFLLALIPIIAILGGISALKDDFPKKEFNEKILPDAEGKRTFLTTKKPKILQIDIKGIIGTEKLNYSKLRDMLVQSREGDLEDNLVKGILLYINTPGGTVIDSDGIYHALKAYKEQYNVPIYAYVDGLCASGGMYIASAADKVYSSNVSLIGSVGVLLSTFPNFTETLEKIGVKTITISAGKGKDSMNPFRKWKEGEADNFELLTDYYYKQFVDLVVSNRPQVSKEKLIEVYGAKIFPAKMAKEYGFVDVIGANRKDTLTELVEASGIEGDYQVVSLEKENWLENIFNMKSPLFTGKVVHSFHLNGSLPPELENKFLYLYRPLL